MTVVRNTKTTGGLDQTSERCGAALLRRHAGSDATVIAAAGEIDASNIARFTEYAEDNVGRGRPLVIDLTGLDFLAAQGIPALLRIGERCADAGVQWALVPSHPVRRLLRICDKHGQLPAVSTIGEALQRFSSPRRAGGLLQLVTKTS